jgi:hypothetical protein
MTNHEKLQQALANMSNEPYGIPGEYWKYTSNSNSDFTKNKLYKAIRPLNESFALIDDKGKGEGYALFNLEYFTKATKEELEAHFGITNKEIVGYICPMDLFAGNIPKGTLYTKKLKGENGYSPENWLDRADAYYLPNEIVELWEPAYAKKEVTVNMAEGFDLIIKDNKVFHKEEDITGFVKELCKLFTDMPIHRYTVSVQEATFSKTGCEHKTTTLKQWQAVLAMLD